MTRWLAGQWPLLKELTFTAKWPSVPASIGFSQARVYAVGPLRGLPAVKHCRIHQPFCQSLAACLVSSWHTNLGSLDLAGCDISGAALQPFDRVRWPCLTELRLSKSKLDAEAMGYALTGKMPVLQHLVLERCKGMDAAAFQQLSKSFLPQLKVLALSHSLLLNGQAVPAGAIPERVDMESIDCMKALTKARWPRLERLGLGGCRVTVDALMELVKGQWSELLHLNLTCTGLQWKCPESLRGNSRQSLQLRKDLLWPTKLLEAGLWPKLNCIDVSIEQ